MLSSPLAGSAAFPPRYTPPSALPLLRHAISAPRVVSTLNPCLARAAARLEKKRDGARERREREEKEREERESEKKREEGESSQVERHVRVTTRTGRKWRLRVETVGRKPAASHAGGAAAPASYRTYTSAWLSVEC